MECPPFVREWMTRERAQGVGSSGIGHYHGKYGFDVLDESGRVARLLQVFAEIYLVGSRQDEDLSITREKRFETRTRLFEKALTADDAAELLGPGVALDPPSQISQSNPVAAG